MNILQIANKAIFPPDGGSLAILSLAKSYIKNGHTVHLVNMITHKHVNNSDIIEEEYKNSFQLTGIKVNTQISIFKLVLNFLFSNKPYISQRFISKEFEINLIVILKANSFDFIQIEGLYVLQYINLIREHFNGKILYRSHNIEFKIWQRNYKETKSLLKKIYFKSLYKRLQKLEIKLINRYDYLIPISKSDEVIYNALGNNKPFLTAPFGINIKKLENKQVNSNLNTKPSLNFIGALDWIPNQKGIIWFIDNCFPNILESFPHIILNIAGRNAPSWLSKRFEHKNIQFFGEVDNAYEFFQTPGPMIVPLFSGSGMRVKIIEGMALKKVIIATNIAVEGISCTHNKNIILANTINDFTNNILSIVDNISLQNTIGEQASEFVKENFDFEKIGSSIINFIK